MAKTNHEKIDGAAGLTFGTVWPYAPSVEGIDHFTIRPRHE